MDTYYFYNKLLKIKQQKWLRPAHRDLGGTYHLYPATIIFVWNAPRPVHSFLNAKGGQYQDLRWLCFHYQWSQKHRGTMRCRARNRGKHLKLMRVRAKTYKSLTSVWCHRCSTLKGRVHTTVAVGPGRAGTGRDCPAGAQVPFGRGKLSRGTGATAAQQCERT